MADATLLPTVSPKHLGKQLRAVRRRKGLSLSEVARGAGLSRRELVAYERGKVKIPESDLWVIAGSCGVDVAELVPPTDPMALSAAPSTIEDSISQLRRNHRGDGGLQRHLDTLYALRALPPGSVVQLQERDRAAMAGALGGDPASIESRLVETMRISHDEARRLRALIVGDAPRYTPLALDPPAPEPEPAPAPAPAPPPAPQSWFDGAAAFVGEAADVDSSPTSAADLPSGPVDVFEELAKLPDPIALTDQHAVGDEMFSRPPEPVSVHAAADASAAGAFATWSSVRSALPEPSAPVVVEPAAPATTPGDPGFGASHAPPIDVVGRPDVASVPGGPDVVENGGWEPPAPATRSWDSWVTPHETTDDAPPEHMVEFVDEYTDEAFLGEIAEPSTDAPTDAPTDAEKAAAEGSWGSWARTAFLDDAPGLDGRSADEAFTGASFTDGRSVGTELTDDPLDPSVDPATDPSMDDASFPLPDPSLSATPWGHQPDPEASSTGFYVDWGGSDTPVEDTPVEHTPVQDTRVEDTATEEATPADNRPVVDTTMSGSLVDDTTIDQQPVFDPALSDDLVDDTTVVADALIDTTVDDPGFPSDPFADHCDDLRLDDPAPISWRPLADTVLAAVAAEMAATGALDREPEPEPAPEPVEEFVFAGAEWELGNALPLVEVRGQGGLVMRRADERWALADVVASPSFALEIDVDFRSGPGFGVLFCASTDADGHMSGYSFDVDPIHEGGSYLVRQWHADRELWNPIARVPAPDPADMHGVLTLRVVVIDDDVTASVNGNVVLTVESLKQACADRNREPATGDRVGIQAWSSSDLVIDSLRVAER